MQRRHAALTIMAFGCATVPLRLLAQQQPKVWRVGSISLASAPSDVTDVFVRRLHELGYVEGKNIVFERRYVAGDVARLPQAAADLVKLNVDLILVSTNQVADAAKRATRTIPIVCPVAADPVGSGLAQSLAHPGGNVTGISAMGVELAGWKLQLLREIISDVRRVAVLALAHATEAGFATGSRLTLENLRQPAEQLGIEILPQAVRVVADIPKAFAAMRREKAQALMVQATTLSLDHRALIVDLAAKHRLLAIYDTTHFTDAGGLISYGPDFAKIYRRAAEIVATILKGMNPADMPFEQPDTYQLAINMKTANALGIKIPRSILLRADTVIE